MTLLEQLYRFVQPIQRKIQSIVVKASLLNYEHNKKLPLLKVQLGPDEVRENIEFIQSYGFSSRPGKGADVLTLFVGGVRDHGIAVVVDSGNDRIKLDAEGDVAIFRKTGEQVYLRQGKVEIKADTIELGEGALQKLMNKAAMDAFNTHTHLVPLPTPTSPTSSLVPTIPMIENIHTTIKAKGV